MQIDTSIPFERRNDTFAEKEKFLVFTSGWTLDAAARRRTCAEEKLCHDSRCAIGPKGSNALRVMIDLTRELVAVREHRCLGGLAKLIAAVTRFARDERRWK